jgi:hypothetical protein
MATRAQARRRFIIAVAVATFTATAAVGVSGQDAAYADQNISHTFENVSCVVQIGTSQVQQISDISVGFVVPDSANPDAEFTVTFPGSSRLLPATAGNLTVTSHSNLSMTYQVQGGTFVDGSIVNTGTATLVPTSGAATQTIIQTADVIAPDKFKFGNPTNTAGLAFPPGTLTTPTISVKVKAPASGTVTINALAITQTMRLNNSLNAAVSCAIPTTTLAVVPIVATGPDLTVTKSHTGDFLPGQEGAEYEIEVTNSGSAATSADVSVVDAIPEGLAATHIVGPGWDCDLPTVSCTRADALSIGASYPPITVITAVAPSAPDHVTNTATVSGGGESEAATGNNTAIDLTAIVRPDLVVEKSHSGNFHVGQEGAHYALAVSNVGPIPSSGTVHVVDNLPAGLIATAISGEGWDCQLSSLTCDRSDVLAAGALYPAIDVTVDVPVTGVSNLTNTATATGGAELNTSNSSDSDPTIIDYPDLTISKSHSGPFTHALGGSYTLVVSNGGAAATIGEIAVADALPTGMSATAMSGPGWSCDLASATCTTTETLASGASLPAITLTVAVAADAASHLTNVATVSGGAEINTTNNTATDLTSVGRPTLGVSMTHAGTIVAGLPFTETISVENTSSIEAVGGVALSATLPNGVSVLGLSGIGWVCDPVTVECTRDDTLLPGVEFPSIVATLQTGTGLVGEVPLSAVVTTGNEADPVTATATDELYVLSATKPYVTVSDASVVTPTDGDEKLMTFDVALSWPFRSTVSARFTTKDKTATAAGNDYDSVVGLVTFVPGQTAETISIVVHGTGEYGANETMQLALSAPVNAVMGDATGTGTIVHPGGPLSIDVNDVLVPRPTTGTTPATFTLSLSAPVPAGSQVTATVETVDGTAKAASGDYVPLGRIVVTFNPGEQQRAVPVTVNGGPTGTKVFKLRIVKSVGATTADAIGTATISR